MAEGHSIQARIQAVSQMSFTDEQGHPRQFTWRTIQTWYSRYQKHGVTVMENGSSGMSWGILIGWNGPDDSSTAGGASVGSTAAPCWF
jgi:hypothetical protein